MQGSGTFFRLHVCRGGPNLMEAACAEQSALGPPRWGLVDVDGIQPRVAPILAELALVPPWAGIGSSLRDLNKNIYETIHKRAAK